MRETALHTDAENALTALAEVLDPAHKEASLHAAEELIHLLLEPSRQLVLYLGTGCSISVDSPGKDWRGRSWVGLLEELLARCPGVQPDVFFEEMLERADIEDRTQQRRRIKNKSFVLSELLPYYDKLQLAWLISSKFPPNKRDGVIEGIVQPPPEAELISPLMSELVELPFRDIVTTNYDSILPAFLDKRKRDPREYFIIFDRGTLGRSFQKPGAARIVYVHGKVPETVHSEDQKLILDRFDYPRLLIERDGILDFVTALLRDSHALYVGFGLDDPSFNFIESRLHAREGQFRPESFAIVNKATPEEHRSWNSRNMNLIHVSSLEHIPALVASINKVLDYVRNAEPNRPESVRKEDDRTRDYMPQALADYIEGNFQGSHDRCRAALATTLFWRTTARIREPEASGHESVRILDVVEAMKLCEIRLRLALSHYKLLSNPTEREHHRERMGINLTEACNLISRHSNRPLDGVRKDQLEKRWWPYRSSLGIIHARSDYHMGHYSRAKGRYECIIKKTEEFYRGGVNAFVRNAAKEDVVLTGLKTAEAYLYAQCQLSRIDYQLPKANARLVAQRTKGRDAMKASAEFARKIVGKLPKLVQLDRNDRNYYDRCFRSLYKIAHWSGGRQGIGVFSGALPPSDECTNDELLVKLNKGLAMLEEGGIPEDEREGDREGRGPVVDEHIVIMPGGPSPDKATCRADRRPTISSLRASGPSRQWHALRCRYLARGYALRWLCEATRKPQGARDQDLLLAYRFVQKALDLTSGHGSERHRIVTDLEAARLNLIVLLGERRLSGPSVPPSSLTCSAAMYYLDQSFAEIDKLERQSGGRFWLEALGKRLAAYLMLVEFPFQQLTVSSELLKKFIGETDHKAAIIRAFEEVEEEDGSSSDSLMKTRTRLFEDSYEKLKKELTWSC